MAGFICAIEQSVSDGANTTASACGVMRVTGSCSTTLWKSHSSCSRMVRRTADVPLERLAQCGAALAHVALVLLHRLEHVEEQRRVDHAVVQLAQPLLHDAGDRVRVRQQHQRFARRVAAVHGRPLDALDLRHAARQAKDAFDVHHQRRRRVVGAQRSGAASSPARPPPPPPPPQSTRGRASSAAGARAASPCTAPESAARRARRRRRRRSPPAARRRTADCAARRAATRRASATAAASRRRRRGAAGCRGARAATATAAVRWRSAAPAAEAVSAAAAARWPACWPRRAALRSVLVGATAGTANAAAGMILSALTHSAIDGRPVGSTSQHQRTSCAMSRCGGGSRSPRMPLIASCAASSMSMPSIGGARSSSSPHSTPNE
jgi:hypothetical protein